MAAAPRRLQFPDDSLTRNIHVMSLTAACLTSTVSGEVQQQDVGAEAAQVVQRLQVLLQFPVGEFTPEDRRQVTEDVGVQRRGPAPEIRKFKSSSCSDLESVLATVCERWVTVGPCASAHNVGGGTRQMITSHNKDELTRPRRRTCASQGVGTAGSCTLRRLGTAETHSTAREAGRLWPPGPPHLLPAQLLVFLWFFHSSESD